MFPLFSFWNCNYMYFRYLPFIAIELIVNFLYFLFYSGSFHLYSKSVILSLDGSNLLLKLCVKLFVLVFVLFILESTWIFLWFLVLFWNFQFFILFSRVYWHSNSKNLVLFLYCLNAPWDIYIIFLNFPGLASCTLITTYVLIFLVKLQMQIPVLNYFHQHISESSVPSPVKWKKWCHNGRWVWRHMPPGSRPSQFPEDAGAPTAMPTL